MQNTIRLFQDSEILLKNERYASAVALAITSIEEAGKYVIRAREISHNTLAEGKKQFAHLPKHVELGEFYWKIAIWTVLLETVADFRIWLEKQPHLSDFYNEIKGLSENEAVTHLQHYMFKSTDELESYVRSRYTDKHYLEVRDLAREGRIEEIRRTGLYCDINSEYQVTRNPEMLKKADAEEWLAHARAALGQVKVWHDIISNETI